MPVLSVVVPVYNVSSFLDKCLDSIVNQTFKDIEIICINDGSTDNSLEILQKWQLKDARISVYDQPNRGVSVARNIGIKNSKGKYIIFIDSDDFIASNMFQVLINSAEDNDLDLVGCSYQTYPAKHIRDFMFRTGVVGDFYSLIKTNSCIQSSNDLCFCWRYLIRKDILQKNNLVFNETIHLGEDMIFMTDVMFHSHKILLKNNPFYFYRINNENSVMTRKKYSPYIESSLSLFYAIKKRQITMYQIDKYSPYSEDLALYTINVYLPMMVKNIKMKYNNVLPKDEIKRIINLPMIRDAARIIGFKNHYSTLKEYIFYLAIKFKYYHIIQRVYSA